MKFLIKFKFTLTVFIFPSIWENKFGCEMLLLYSPAVPPPPTQLLTIDDIFPKLDEPPQLEILRSHLFGEGRLTEKAALKIIEETAAIFKSEDNLIELEAPITGTSNYNEILMLNES